LTCESLRSARVTLAVALALLAGAIYVVLSGSPPTVAGRHPIPTRNLAALASGRRSTCQNGGTIPRHTSAIRLPFSGNFGPRVSISVSSGDQRLISAEQAAGWGPAQALVVPLDDDVPGPIPRAVICVTLGPPVGTFQINSTKSGTHLEYLRPGARSWLSRASSVAYHMGLGRAASGVWVVFLVLALMIGIVALVARLEFGGGATSVQSPAKASAGPSKLLRSAIAGLWRAPNAAEICVLVAFLNAVCWSVITPPFQVPDEPSHFAYTQQLAENKQLPTSGGSDLSPEEEVVLRDLHQARVSLHPENHTISSGAEQRRLQKDLARGLSRKGGGGAEGAASDPPLYYLLEVVPYELGSAATLLDQLELMRLLSALMAGLTALFVFLFVREVVPAVPWAWVVGGLSVALAPLLGFMSGAVNPDSMLFAVSAAVFYCLARGFRRGLTRRLAIVIGALTAAGFLTKLNFIGLAPGAILGLIVLTIRAARTVGRRNALLSLGIALGIAASPAVLYSVANLLSNHPVLGIVSTTLGHGTPSRSILDEISYTWQFYLPRLPGMTNYFPGISTTRDLWFNKLVGFYGWLDTPFPAWVDNLALVPAGLLAVLLLHALIRAHAALREHLVELLVYGTMVVGLMALIGASDYLKRSTEGLDFAQPRYLLPLLPLVGVALALVARGVGRRWGPSVGALIVVLFLAHDAFSQLQVVSRFYG
jgi:Predicted membrane protein (DUF2142)